MASFPKRLQNQPAFVLQHWPYSETSLLIDLFTEQSGRITVIAKGARRLKSRYRGVLLPFQPLAVLFTGKGDVKTLTGAEPVGLRLLLSRDHLMCGFYLNELIIKMLYRYDPYESLYSVYERAVLELSRKSDAEFTLRRFEKHLLEQAGYGLHLQNDISTGLPIDKNVVYRYLPELGPIVDSNSRNDGVLIHGDALIALEQEESFTDRVRKELKQLSRTVLATHLQGKPLNSRRMYVQLYPDKDSTETVARHHEFKSVQIGGKDH